MHLLELGHEPVNLRPSHALLFLPAVIGLSLYAHALGYALLGYDTYPLIIASRVLSWTDFWGTFTEVMMDRRFPSGDFYRPTQNAVIAVEYALWGTNPAGYQFTALLLFAGSIAALVLLIRRLLDNDSIAAPLVGGLFLALHQSHLVTLPVMARRPELLVMLAWLSALLILPIRNQRGLIWRSILSALLILFASGAKENGVLGVGLIALHQVFFTAGTLRNRFKRAAVASAFATFSVAIYLVARFAVVGGAGGYVTTGFSLAAWWTNVRVYSMNFVEAVLCPWNYLPFGDPTRVAFVSLLILLALSAFAVAPALARRAKPVPPYVGLLFLGGAWTIANVLFNGFAENFSTRYVTLPTAGTALVLAALAQWAISLFHHASSPRRELEVEQASEFRYGTRPMAVVSCSLLAGIVAISLQSSPLFVNYWEWPEASRRENEFLAALDNTLRSATPGARVEAPRLPYIVRSPNENRPRLLVPAVLADYSIQAWAELHAADRTIRVVSASAPRISAPNPDEILLVVRDQPPIIDRFRIQIPFALRSLSDRVGEVSSSTH